MEVKYGEKRFQAEETAHGEDLRRKKAWVVGRTVGRWICWSIASNRQVERTTGLEGTVRADFKGLPPGKTLDFFLMGNGKPLWDSQILSFDAAVCLADFAIRTNFRLPSPFQDTSITPHLISCGATQTAPAIVSLYRTPSFPSCVSSHLLWRGLPAGFSSSPYSLCNSLFCACLHLLLGRHCSTILPWVQRAIEAQVSAEICNCFKFIVKKNCICLSTVQRLAWFFALFFCI